MKGDHCGWVTQLATYSINKKEVVFSIWSLTEPQPQQLSLPSTWNGAAVVSHRGELWLENALLGCGCMPLQQGRGREEKGEKYNSLKKQTPFFVCLVLFMYIKWTLWWSEKDPHKNPS